jgi:hypothetical protein
LIRHPKPWRRINVFVCSRGGRHSANLPSQFVRNTTVNITLSTRVDEQKQKHPPSPVQPVSRHQNVSLADRAALHLGLALITWSRRSRTVAPEASQVDLNTRREASLARAARESQWQLALYQSQARR